MSKSEQSDSEGTKQAEKAAGEELAGRGQIEAETDDLSVLQAEFLAAERKRKRRALMGGLGILLSVAVFLWAMLTFRETVFRPALEVEASEQNVLAETNDPVCRGLIERVTAIGQAYLEQESVIERGLGSADRAEVLRVEVLLEEKRARLSDVGQTIPEAVLRYDKSRGELERWFAYVDTEIGHLVGLASARAAGLEEEGGGEVSAASLALQDKALLAVHESFQSFRVWHSSALHPCGRAEQELEL